MFEQFDWLHLLTFITGGLVGVFVTSAMTSGKVSDLETETDYYKRLAKRDKEE